MGAKRILVADLDARTVNIEKKLEEVVALTKNAGARMEGAFTRIANVTEKSLNKSSSAFQNFSKRDLGILASQLLNSADISGKLANQLSNLATGLLTGGAIGGAFAGFAAIINLINTNHEEQIKLVNELTGSLDKARDNVVSLTTEFEKLLEPSFLEKLLIAMTGNMNNSEFKYRMDMLEKIGGTFKKLEQEEGTVKFRLENQIKINTELRDSATNAAEYMMYQSKINLFQEQFNDLQLKNKNIKIDTAKLEKEALDRLQKYSNFISPRGIDTDALLKGIDTPDLSNKKFEVSPIDDWTMSILEWKKDGGLREPIEEAQDPMSALVSLSNQMASNFSFAGHTFVGQLSQAIAMVDSISNMILTVASMFGGGGGFGIGGLLSLIGLEKGGRVTNLHGAISYTKIPSFAMGGSYTTPNYGGSYPVLVHKNETLDVYNAGSTSRMEKKLDRIANLMWSNALHTSGIRQNTKDLSNRPIIIKIDGKKLMEVNEGYRNRGLRSGKNFEDFG
jgi:hypothetical protein